MKNICVVSGSRAEYGLIKRLVNCIKRSSLMDLKFVVTGPHLSAEFGHSVNEIIEDKIEIHERINTQISGQTGADVTKSIGLGAIGFADYFKRTKPDILLVMGDRYEILPVAIAAFMEGVSVAHISGGELSLGSKDDVIRHMITKLSSIHFVSAEEHARRVVQLGENPKTVFNVGEPGLDDLKEIDLLNRDELESLFGIELNRRIFVMTFHPAGMNKDVTLDLDSVKPLLRALEFYPDTLVMCSLPNSDAGGAAVREALLTYQQANKDNFHLYNSFGRNAYLSLVSLSEVVIGNSSSALVEVPLLGVPSVDIGNRQKGRLRGQSVLHAENETEKIVQAINKAMSEDHKILASKKSTPYGDGNACDKIVSILEGAEMTNLGKKDFFDVNFEFENGLG